MPTALITGILGQDGSLLGELLKDRGYRVVGVVRPGSVNSAAIGAASSGYELVELDLAEQRGAAWATDLIARVQPDEVYHLAACHHSSTKGGGVDSALQQRMVDVNFGAGLALAHGLIARGRGSFVMAGSSQMFTPTIPALSIDERAPRAPSTFYGVTKAGCADAVAWLRQHQGLLGSCAILFNHESTRRTAAFVSRKVSLSAARISAGLESTLALADVSSAADFSSASDIVDGMCLMASRGIPGDFVLASGELHSVAELCEVAFRAVGLNWRDHVLCSKPEGERPALVGDPKRAERELGWRRRDSFEEWVTRMVDTDRQRVTNAE